MSKKGNNVKEELLEMLNGYLHPKLVELIQSLGIIEERMEVKFTSHSSKTYKILTDGKISMYTGQSKGWKTFDYKKSKLYEDKTSEELLKISETYGANIIKLKKKENKIREGIEKLKKSGCYIELYERVLMTEKKD